ncbi:MAG TPA: cytochrome c oxidase assembly protein [Candidatus Aquilonibacter sp.]|nr:cytochrome c oxidase assembly protein [Candidatus Aquilonibacter sp.]
MLSPSEAALASWSFPPIVSTLNILAALLYIRGWLSLRLLIPDRFAAWRLASFLSGIATLQIALASPIDAFDSFFLTDHMIQHLLLMMLVPPLILMGNPAIPVMRGLPRGARRVLGWLLKHRPLSWLAQIVTRPAICWLLFAIAMLAWHLPRPYDLALRSPAWHDVEHASFFITSLFFWWPVIQPWPSRAHLPRWGLIPYLLLADFTNSILCAFLVFSGRALYPYYLEFPRINALSVQNDQVIAGAVMWVVGSLAFLIPAVGIAVNLLSPAPPIAQPRRGQRASVTRMHRTVLPVLICALPLAALGYGFGTKDSVDIDGDAILAHARSRQVDVTLFADPQLSAGANDLAVLVRDAVSETPILDSDVDISAEPEDGRAHPTGAVPQPASNKLLEAATLDVPKPGIWNIEVHVRRGAQQIIVDSKIDVSAKGR